MEEIIKELKILYPHTKFKSSYADNNKILIYDNRNLIWDNDFSNKVLDLAEKYLTEEQFLHFAYLYDYLKEIENIDLKS
jgi:hypothetical protein